MVPITDTQATAIKVFGLHQSGDFIRAITERAGRFLKLRRSDLTGAQLVRDPWKLRYGSLPFLRRSPCGSDCLLSKLLGPAKLPYQRFEPDTAVGGLLRVYRKGKRELRPQQPERLITLQSLLEDPGLVVELVSLEKISLFL